MLLDSQVLRALSQFLAHVVREGLIVLLHTAVSAKSFLLHCLVKLSLMLDTLVEDLAHVVRKLLRLLLGHERFETRGLIHHLIDLDGAHHLVLLRLSFARFHLVRHPALVHLLTWQHLRLLVRRNRVLFHPVNLGWPV